MTTPPQWHAFESPVLAGLPDLAKAQVVQQINCRLLAELIDAAGGEVVLPPGFRERAAQVGFVVKTSFLEDGSYRVWTEALELSEPENGTLWERMSGPRKQPAREVYGVAGKDPADVVYTTLCRIDPNTGAVIKGTPLLRVQSDHLRRGVGGWRRFKPSDEQVEAFAGRPL